MAVDPAGFRRVGDQVELRGTIVNQTPEETGGGGTVVFTLPEGYRPPADKAFRVESQRGPTVVTVKPDGTVVADATDGWVSLNGISYTTEEPRPAE